jgi:hypothetical protein
LASIVFLLSAMASHASTSRSAAPAAAATTSGAPAAGGGSVLDDMLTPLERNVKT